ncbi:MAG: hypothetical protein HOL01_20140 [Planctomycetaceae bacterium]|jgi:hypothetical protein|nr:hypothetical protein [Planctomycetaceae bacterium]MBT6484050.1 hypothetical protein [Planctomycetaceae bacterium]MBT6496849.1 hypothetical protein [Planctomycetaceae bacterium]
MKSLKLAAVAALVSWISLNGEEVSAQSFYGYPTAAPQYRTYTPTSLPSGNRAPASYGGTSYRNCAYGNCRTSPVGRPSSRYPANSFPSGQYSRPAYRYQQPVYGAPASIQPAGSYRTPVFYRSGVPQPVGTQYRAPVNRPVYPSAGHFSIEDPFTNSATTTAPQRPSPAALPASFTNSPFFQDHGTRVPTGAYTPASSNRPVPVDSAPFSSSPFYP